MEPWAPFAAVGLALAAGLLIGLEREQTQASSAGDSASPFLGGVRTFPLFALLGALSLILAPAVPWLPLVSFAAVAVFAGIGWTDDVKHGRDRGLHTEVAALVTWLIGALAASEGVVEPFARRAVVAAGLAVVVTFLLSAKPRLQSLVSRVSRDDLVATVKFLIVAVVVLPLLPDVAVGPFDVVNPFKLGLMVVLIAGIGFCGYVASRVFGAGRGLVVTAVLGGLASSTAVTLSFAGRAKAEPASTPGAALAIVLASTVMFGRVVVEVAAVHAPLVRLVIGPLLAMAVTGLVAAAVTYGKQQQQDAAAAPASVVLQNPFDLVTAVRFALLFAVVLVVSKAAQEYLGTAGMYAAAALAGTTDVDAITLSTASLAAKGLDEKVAATTILIGALSNTVVKAGLAASLGGRALGVRVGAAFGAAAVAGAVGLVVVWLG